jgi:hypothetical protein
MVRFIKVLQKTAFGWASKLALPFDEPGCGVFASVKASYDDASAESEVSRGRDSDRAVLRSCILEELYQRLVEQSGHSRWLCFWEFAEEC